MVELGNIDALKLLCYLYYYLETIMHNLISFNQLAGTKHMDDPHEDKIDEYYECLIDCEDDQHVCKRICKEVLI